MMQFRYPLQAARVSFWACACRRWSRPAVPAKREVVVLDLAPTVFASRAFSSGDSTRGVGFLVARRRHHRLLHYPDPAYRRKAEEGVHPADDLAGFVL